MCFIKVLGNKTNFICRVGAEKQVVLVPVVALEGFRIPWTILPGAEGVVACCAGKMNSAMPPCVFVAVQQEVSCLKNHAIFM